jgi:hypothetical protein
MNIPHPRMTDAHKTYDELRKLKRLAPYKPQKCASLFAPSQSGKSKTVESYIETQVVDEVIAAHLFPADMDREDIARMQRIALHVTLGSNATPKSLAGDILEGFGDPHARTGTEVSLLGRVYRYMKHFGTQILFIDEVQHLDNRLTENEKKIERASAPLSSAVPDALKTMLIRGLIPIVFIGTSEARNMIMSERQLRERCLCHIDFSTLRPEVFKERDIFERYLEHLGVKIKQHGVLDEVADLLGAGLPPLIHIVAGGRLGAASNFVAAACMVARERGASRLSREHLASAVNEWAIPNELIAYNPFEQGIQDYERRRR